MFFETIQEAPGDPIFGLNNTFAQDQREKKVNLSVGIYQDEQLRSDIFLSAKRAKEEIFTQDLMANYLPIDGLQEMIRLLGPLVFKDQWQEERMYGAHVVGDTAALRIGGEFFREFVSSRISLPNLTWPNHRSVFEKAGCEIDIYPYYSRELKNFDLKKVVQHLKGLPPKTVVVLHASCHNPTGCDPSLEEWRELSQLMKEKELFPFFDCAYQGLGDGLQKDVEAIGLFCQDGHEMAIAYSCSKNFSMYCQRVGALFMVGHEKQSKIRVASQIKRIIRALYSNPPSHGAKIVTEILKREDLRSPWMKDLEKLRHRINLMREALIQRLISSAKDIDFTYLKKHKGMFSFMDLDPSQVQMLIDRFGVYLTGGGRINVSGLTEKNINYVVSSLLSVMKMPKENHNVRS